LLNSDNVLIARRIISCVLGIIAYHQISIAIMDGPV